MTLNADPRLPFLAERGRFKGNLIQAVLMNQLYSLAREMTNLTDVQIRILDHMEAALQLAADISKNQIYICAKGKNESVEIVLLAAKPSYSMGNTFLTEGCLFR